MTVEPRAEAGAGPAPEPILETRLVAAPAAPAAAPGDALARARLGARQVAVALEVLARDRALRRAALVPTALTFAGCAALAWAASGADGEATRGEAFHAFLVSFVALASMPPTLLARQWTRVALEARRALGIPAGEDPFAGVAYPRLLGREWLKALRQAIVVSAGIAPLVVLVSVLPLGRGVSAALAAAWAFYWVVLDALELPIEAVPGPPPAAPEPWFARALQAGARRSRWLRPAGWLGRTLVRLTRPWHEEAAFTERHPWESAGLGAAVGAVLLVPVLGLCFRAVGIVAVTALLAAVEPERAGRG